METTYRIRNMKIKDIDEVYELGMNEKRFTVIKRKYPFRSNGFWGKNILQDLIKSKLDPTYVQTINDNIAGFVIATIHPLTKKATIENLYVKKEYRRKDIGKNLLRCALIEASVQGAKYRCALVEKDNRVIQRVVKNLNGDISSKEFLWAELNALL